MNIRANFSLTQLEYVLAVFKTGHFAKAAEECNVTQPTLSMQIQKLETDLGVTIFDRSKKPILLTEMGKALIEQMRAIVLESRKIETLISQAQNAEITGTLSLGVIPTIAPYLLPRLLPTLEKEMSNVKFILREMQTHQIVEALQNDELDVGLLATPLNIKKIFEHPLYYEPFQLLCSSQNELATQKKVTGSQLKGEDIWLLEEGHCLRNQILEICSKRKSAVKERKFNFESGNLETLKGLVDNFGGYTLLPWLASRDLGSNSSLIEFERPVPAREVGLVYRREHYKINLIEALAAAVLDAIPEKLRKIRPKDLEVLPVT